MRLCMAASTEYARHVIDHGFVGEPWYPLKTDEQGRPLRDEEGRPIRTEERLERCEFRDMPSSGWIWSRTTEAETQVDEEGIVGVVVSGGPSLLEDPGDFTLCIEVPQDLALKWEVREDKPEGWPFREFWLTPEEANRYLDTLKVYDAMDGEEIRPDLVGK